MQITKQSSNCLQYKIAYYIIFKLIKLYPQAIYYPIRANLHYNRNKLRAKEREEEARLLKTLLKKCQASLSSRNNRVLEAIETLISEMTDVYKNLDENFSHILL